MKEDIIKIRKYSNRRLYDTSTSSYVKLADVGEMIRQGKEIQVVDATTNEDITRTIMLQIICENKSEQEALPISFLRNVIQAGNKGIRNAIKEYLTVGLSGQSEIQKHLAQWTKLATVFNPFMPPWLRENTPFHPSQSMEEQPPQEHIPAEPPPADKISTNGGGKASTTEANGVETPVMESPPESELDQLRQDFAAMQKRLEELTKSKGN